MAKITGGSRITAELERRAKNLSTAKEVRVGFLENATYPDGKSVALVAAVNEFGAPSRGIPPRPFFRGMIAQHSAEWGPGLSALLKANDYDAARALDIAGAGIEGQLRQAIVDYNAGPPLADSTIARKTGKGRVRKIAGVFGPEKQLVDTGHMLNSVDHEVVKK